MSAAKWQVHKRRDLDLLTHLCAIRQFSPKDLALNFTTGLHNPDLLPDMAKARALMRQAVKENWHITVFGDYDADGTPASAVLATLCERLGLKYDVIIPTRAEGYGLKKRHIEAITKVSQLLITVDTGVTAIEEIQLANDLKLRVIVLDHHLPKPELPPADALVDPFLAGSTYPFVNLCGCALAYKFVVALAQDFPTQITEGFSKWLLDLVAISTVADMMKMQGENRVLVHYGLQVLAKTRRLGLRALLESAGVNPLDVSAEALGYILGPRLNASGRMGDNYPAYQLLMATDPDQAARLAGDINRANKERQATVEAVTLQAESLLFVQNKPDDFCFIVTGDAWPAGVIGLVAGKLSARYHRPVVVLTAHVDDLTGSARSTANYSIIDGLAAQTANLERFGGHRQAAGLALKKNQLQSFVDGLKTDAQQRLTAEDLQPLIQADALLENADINLATIQLCQKLQPFGLENPAPVFIIDGVTLGPLQKMGKDQSHAKWQAKKDDLNFEVVGFGLAKQAQERSLDRAQIIGQLEENIWQGRSRLQFKIKDFRSSGEKIDEIEAPA